MQPFVVKILDPISRRPEIHDATFQPPERIERLGLPERAGLLGGSVAETERAFEIFAGGDGLLNLTYADTHRFPPPAEALEAFVAAVRGEEPYTPYRGDAVVRARVAESVSTFLGVPVDAEREVLLTAGTQAGLFQAFATTVEHGDVVLLGDPDYLCNERMLRFFGATVRHFAVDHGSSGSFMDLEEIEAGLRDGARMIVLSHPNNPTGAVFDGETIQQLSALVAHYDALIVVDELYSRLVYDDVVFHHLIARPDVRDRCITLLGPSKTESMTGYRVGVVVAPPRVADAMELLEGVTTIRAPAYSQHALRGWLHTDHQLVQERTRAYQGLRDLAVAKLSSLDFVEISASRGTSYLIPRARGLGLSDVEVALALVRDAHVVVNPGFQFGPRGIGAFRLCFAQDPAVWGEALDRIVAALQVLADRASMTGAAT